MIIDVIISDLVPLKERGNYIAIVLTVYFIGLAVGKLEPVHISHSDY
jgi:hypothetical protein